MNNILNTIVNRMKPIAKGSYNDTHFFHTVTDGIGYVTHQYGDYIGLVTTDKPDGTYHNAEPLERLDHIDAPLGAVNVAIKALETETIYKKTFNVNDLIEVARHCHPDIHYKPWLNGVHFNGQDLAATDEYYMTIKTISDDDIISRGYIIPQSFIKNVLTLYKGESVQVSFTTREDDEQHNYALFSLGSDKYYVKMVNGTFPDYKRCLPKGERGTVTVKQLMNLKDINNIDGIEPVTDNTLLTIKGNKILTPDDKQVGSVTLKDTDISYTVRLWQLKELLRKNKGKSFTVDPYYDNVPYVAAWENTTTVIMPPRT